MPVTSDFSYFWYKEERKSMSVPHKAERQCLLSLLSHYCGLLNCFTLSVKVAF